MWFSFSLHYFSHFVVDERGDKIEGMKTEKMDNLRVAPITKALDTREAWCTTTRTKITFNCMWKKRHFHKKGWAPEQALKKRLKVMGKWPISMVGTSYMIPIWYRWPADSWLGAMCEVALACRIHSLSWCENDPIQQAHGAAPKYEQKNQPRLKTLINDLWRISKTF